MDKSILDLTYYKLLGITRKLNGIVQRHSINIAKNHFKNKEIVCIEIGIRKGQNLLTMEKNLNIHKVYAIDPYPDKEETARRLKKFNNIIWIEKYSKFAISDIQEKVDFIYIDGDHSYDTIKTDIELYHKLLKPDGIIAGHDFDYGEVAYAVMDYANKNKLIVTTGGTPADWWIENECKRIN